MSFCYANKIRERINKAESGTVFVVSDFADIASKETVRRTLSRLTQEGVLRRVLNGVYEKPKYSHFLEAYVSPNAENVAKAIARSFNWTIAPSGNSALNLLGLTTQVPASLCFLSDGPYRTFEYDNIKIEFKRRTNREIKNLSYMTGLVIQALKTLGKNNLNDEVISKLKMKLSGKEKDTLLKEGRNSTSWIFNVIRQISEG